MVFPMRRAAVVLFSLMALPVFASATAGDCGVSPAFSIDRRADGHLLLSLRHTRLEYDAWSSPAPPVVNGTKIEVVEKVYLDDMVTGYSCETQTVDLGVLPEGRYDVDWTLDAFTSAGPWTYHLQTRFMESATACGAPGELIVAVRPGPRSSGESVQVDVSQLTRASDYDAPSLTRNGSHYAIEQTERVNSIAIIEGAPTVCRTRTFVLGPLAEGDYDVTVTQPVDDPAGNKTLAGSAAFHVDASQPRRRGVRH